MRVLGDHGTTTIRKSKWTKANYSAIAIVRVCPSTRMMTGMQQTAEFEGREHLMR